MCKNDTIKTDDKTDYRTPLKPIRYEEKRWDCGEWGRGLTISVHYLCPTCGCNVDDAVNFCTYCGQALDWNEPEAVN